MALLFQITLGVNFAYIPLKALRHREIEEGPSRDRRKPYTSLRSRVGS